MAQPDQSRSVHYIPHGNTTLCGIDRRQSGELHTTNYKVAVTCPICQGYIDLNVLFNSYKNRLPRTERS
ncbi:hypothetical protein UFOVP134_46 [uncultured Caudovirales phage]|uniref:Uncharacterized protein n=1 Tax=uncultured Caudovirales phage TaxID=2100421 RepID=A0A6J5LFW1_9CAUD|nr:hypothetical protein UFOVP134_46 [uncultured Caudovirales phage]